MDHGTSSSSMTPVASRKSYAYPAQQKRKYLGACDACKRRKVRCDSGHDLGYKCSNCVSSGNACTHEELAKKPMYLKGYVESLEKRLDAMQKLLHRLVPAIDIEKELEADGDDRGTTSETLVPSDSVVRNDDDEVIDTLEVRMKMLKVDPNLSRFFGKSSQYYLIQQVINQRVSAAPEQTRSNLQNWNQRYKYWDPRPWLQYRVIPLYPDYFSFPPSDLLPRLADLYFEVVNSYEPLLHKPTFQRSLDEQLHFRDPEFAMLVLLVCALGARFCDDDRVFLDGMKEFPESAGAEWFNQVNLTRIDHHDKISLYHLQCHILSIMYSEASGLVSGVFIAVGHAMRLAIDVGAHRRKGSEPTVVSELWKRAFWALLIINHTVSAYVGLPVTLSEDDYDQDYPLEVDDEYWSDGFQQPEGVLSKLSYHVHNIKLFEILARTLEKTYTVKKNLAVSPQETLAELDSALNKWLTDVPQSMRWDSTRPNRHSAFIFTTFHYLQICVHRPYIPTSNSQSPLGFPSLLIATSAARSIAKIIGNPVIGNFGLKVPLPLTLLTAYTGGMILLLSTWSGKRAGVLSGTGPDLAHVHECMRFLKNSEERFNWAGQLWDMLSGLAGIADMPPAGAFRYGTGNRHQGEWEFSKNSSPVDLSSEIPLRSQTGSPLFGEGENSSGQSLAQALQGWGIQPANPNLEHPQDSSMSSASVWTMPMIEPTISAESSEAQRELDNAWMQSYTPARQAPGAVWDDIPTDTGYLYSQTEQLDRRHQLDTDALYSQFTVDEEMLLLLTAGSDMFSTDWGPYLTQGQSESR